MRLITGSRYGLIGAIGVALAAVTAGGPAQAVPACPTSSTPIADFESGGPYNTCVIGDKEFHLLDTDLVTGTTLKFTETGVVDIVQQRDPSGTFLKYTMFVLTPGLSIHSVTLSADVNPVGFPTTITKVLKDPDSALVYDTLSVVNSANDSTTAAFTALGIVYLEIDETISLGAGAYINSITNAFTQGENPLLIELPEPMGLALAGAGLLGLGLVRRRRAS